MLYNKHTISAGYIPKIEQAYLDIERQLIPVSRERAEQIIGRLLLHYTHTENEQSHSLRRRYMDALAEYPEDLACAAYQHALHHSLEAILPSVGELLGPVQPELQRRRLLLEKLGILLGQVQQEEAA